jgi:transcriptional regulator with XRE-family HTH domain
LHLEFTGSKLRLGGTRTTLEQGESVNDSVGARLAAALAVRQRSQSDLAEAIGVTAGAVSQWIKGPKQPSRDNVKAAAAFLGVASAWIEAGEGDPPRMDPRREREAHLREASWRFRPTHPDGGRDYGNANIWTFTPTLETLVREALQNVLDARSGDRPVEARLRVIRLSGATSVQELKTFLAALKWGELAAHLEASKDTQQKLGSLLRYALKKINLDDPENTELLLLRVEDRDTVGLVGPETDKGNFAALTRNNLDSSKATSTAAGAFGLGKGVFWRASLLATVLFNSNLSEPQDGRRWNRIIGRTELPWHQVDDERCAGPGWFGMAEGQPAGRVESMWDNRTLAADLFMDREGEATGTTILVVGFADPASEEQSKDPRQLAAQIEAAAARNFWPAMTRGDLKVVVETAEGNRLTSRVEVDAATGAHYYADAFSRFRDGSAGERLGPAGDVAVVPVTIDVPSRLADPDRHDALSHECLLVVRACDDDPEDPQPRGQLAVFRGAGMIVRYYDLNSVRLGARPFRAALMCGTAVDSSPEAVAAERFLRTAEPPAHNGWELTQEIKAEYASGGGVAIARLIERARDAIAGLVAPDYSTLSDGPSDLKSLFRIVPPTDGDKKPRLKVLAHQVDADGRWRVKGRVTTDGARGWWVRPVLVFASDSGPGHKAAWDTLAPSGDHPLTQDGRIAVPAGTKSVEFVAVSNAGSHPVAATQAAVTVELRDLTRMEA